MTNANPDDRLTAPWLFASAVFVFALALLEKALNLAGLGLPLATVYPRQLLDWAVVLLIFDIALTVRQMFESQLRRDRLPQRPGEN